MNTRHSLGWTALQVAAVNEQAEILKILLDNGADINAGDDFVSINRLAMQKGINFVEGAIYIQYENSYLLKQVATLSII